VVIFLSRFLHTQILVPATVSPAWVGGFRRAHCLCVIPSLTGDRSQFSPATMFFRRPSYRPNLQTPPGTNFSRFNFSFPTRLLRSAVEFFFYGCPRQAPAVTPSARRFPIRPLGRLPHPLTFLGMRRTSTARYFAPCPSPLKFGPDIHRVSPYDNVALTGFFPSPCYFCSQFHSLLKAPPSTAHRGVWRCIIISLLRLLMRAYPLPCNRRRVCMLLSC